MIRALKHLASLLGGSQGSSAIVADEADDPTAGLIEKLPPTFTKVIELEIEETNAFESYALKQVVLAPLDVDGEAKYLYRAGGTSGPGVTLTCKLGKSNKSDKSPKTARQHGQTALKKKVIGYLQKMADTANTKEGRKFGKAVASELTKNEAAALDRITEYAEAVHQSKEDSIITLVVNAHGARIYPQDLAQLREFFVQSSSPETREVRGTSSTGENAVCCCCSRLSSKVFCQPQTLPYFTFDKPGFVAGAFFDQEEIQANAWRNFPLCGECILDVRRGFKQVEVRLQFKLCGISYLLIPSFTQWNSASAATVVRTIAAFGQRADPAFQRDQEDLFTTRLRLEDNTASFNYLFFRKKQSRMEILCTIENVLPTRMAEIAEAIDQTNKHDLLAHFGEWSGAVSVGAVTTSFALLRDIYQRSTDTRGDKPVQGFLRSVQRVVYGQPFHEREFFDAVMRYIRDTLRRQQKEGREPWLAMAAHRALAAALWLARLGLMRFGHKTVISLEGGEGMTYPELNAENLNERFEEFFQRFGGLFGREEQRVCYLMGILCAQVLGAQRKKFENRQPFFRHLKDLNLGEAEMRGLLPKMKSKLTDYDVDHFNWGLEAAISERFRRTQSPWKITISEINFFFTLGLCEARLFSPKNADTIDQS
jgi:CRISPR-associated protein Csh1